MSERPDIPKYGDADVDVAQADAVLVLRVMRQLLNEYFEPGTDPELQGDTLLIRRFNKP